MLRNVVGGEHVDAVDGRSMDLVDPTTGEVFGSAPVSGAEDVDRAYAAASTAFETWRDTTPSDRQRAMLRFADAVESHAEELVALESRTPHRPASPGGRRAPLLALGSGQQVVVRSRGQVDDAPHV